MEKTTDLKRKSRNLNEKKRRDQFNNLINELNNLIDPNFSNSFEDDDEMSNAIHQQTANWAESMNFEQTAHTDRHHLDDSSHNNNNSGTTTTNYHHSTSGTSNAAATSIGRPSARTMAGFMPSLQSRASKAASSTSSLAGSTRQKKMDKSSVLKCAMEFLKRHTGLQHQQQEAAQDLVKDSDEQTTINNNKPMGGDSDGGYGAGYLGTSQWKPDYITDDEFSVQMLEALDAFIVVCEVSPEARIIYSSDTLTNLLNYTGTCNSLRHYDYVSLFDLIAPQDRAQIESAFKDHTDKLASGTIVDGPAAQFIVNSGKGTAEYISLATNFRHGLNLTEIKQRRLHQRIGVLRPNGGQNASGGGGKDGTLKGSKEMRDSGYDEKEQQQTLDCQQSMINDSSDEQYHMQISLETPAEVNRSQQSIAEQQQHLLSDGRREEQEHNQQHQQEAHLRRQVAEMMQVDAKQLSTEDQQSSSDSSSVDQGVKQTQQKQQQQQQQQQTSNSSSSGTNSDENDQPNSTGSDDASDSNQSTQKHAKPTERRHLYRHHQHHHHHHRGGGSCCNPKSQKQSTLSRQQQQQYELVRLMATFKSLDDGGTTIHQKQRQDSHDNGNSFNRYKNEEPPPANQVLAKSCYFICIGRLDIPRLSYDLKIIVPPMRSGSNVFHNNQFMSKHTLKWRFLWVDNRAPAIIGYLPFEVLGTSGYDYYHWDDLDKLVISHETLMRDGQASSGPYRFLTKGQQWIWLQTKYCIILKPQYYAEQKKKQRQQQQLLQQQQQQNNLDVMEEEHNAVADIEDGPLMPVGGSYYPPASDLAATCSRRGGVNQQRISIGGQANDAYGTPVYQQPASSYTGGGGGESIDDEGKIIYTTSSMYGEQTTLSYPKKFRLENEVAYNSGTTTAARQETVEYEGGGTSGGANSKAEEQQRRYEKLLKTNDLIKRQSIKAGNSFNSRSLDQFKFILCTHTVIGFDENDGSVNTTSSSSVGKNTTTSSSSAAAAATSTTIAAKLAKATVNNLPNLTINKSHTYKLAG